MKIDSFKVRSLESIGTLSLDIDVGVVRVSSSFLRKNSKRNSLVKITALDRLGKRKASIVRIARAATGSKVRNGKVLKKKALKHDEIALQYDDRLLLDIRKLGSTHTLTVEKISFVYGVPQFLFKHSSPLIRLQTYFAFALFAFGVIAGFMAGMVSFN